MHAFTLFRSATFRRVLVCLSVWIVASVGRGVESPAPQRLWVGPPPEAFPHPPAEVTDANGRIEKITVPTITVFLPPKGKRTGAAAIVCPGGGYGKMDWITHAVNVAADLNPRGVAVIGLKYRTRPPYSTPDVQRVALLDAQRALRTVRSHAAEWGLDPHRIGIIGYSAGAHLAMNLACKFDEGDTSATDPIERQSSRPDFVVGLATWAFREKVSPFTFRANTPPVFMGHARTDGVPIELTESIQAQLEPLKVPVHRYIVQEGGHGAFNLLPNRVKEKFPGALWPDDLFAWLATLPSYDWAVPLITAGDSAKSYDAKDKP